MHTYLDCVPCFIRQTLDSARLFNRNKKTHEKILRRILFLLADMDFSLPPPAMAQKIHKAIRDITGVKDAYTKIKKQSNVFALSLYPKLKKIITKSNDPFSTAVRLAIAGNIIDFGIHSATNELDEIMVHNSIENALKSPINNSNIKHLKTEIKRAGKILYIADNAGEIVFDRLLIEEMPLEKITVAVKGHPIINDATIEDAKAAGLTGLVKVISNGSDAPGTILESCSPEFRQFFNRADLVIAKGQGNYETLSSMRKNIFFLFKAKCHVIANHAKVEVGSIVIIRNHK